jgi:hypothetical protein
VSECTGSLLFPPLSPVCSNQHLMYLHYHRGMTGGCPNHAHYVDDKSYCTPKSRRALGESQALRGVNHRALQTAEDTSKLPVWGMESDKIAAESNYVMCTRFPKAPKLPTKCASLWGDPHVRECSFADKQCAAPGCVTNSLTF